MANRKASWAEAKENLEMFVEGAEAGDRMTAVKLKNGKWRITSITGDYKVIGEDYDFKTALAREKEDHR